MQFIEHNLLWIIIALVVIVILGFIIRQAVKIGLTILAICLILVFLFGVKPAQIFEAGKKTATITQQVYDNTLKPILTSELKNATYHVNPDKTYVIQTKSFKIMGVLGQNKATLYYKNSHFTIDVTPIEELLKKMESDYQKQASK